MTAEPRICAVIPVFNHGTTLSGIVDSLETFGLPVIMVDDGSNLETRNTIDGIGAGAPDRQLVRLPVNQGKGAAVMAGLKEAESMGFSHALQVDADGQHDISRIPFFLEQCRKSPESLIAGAPVYDESAPKSRLIGRKITDFWVKAETLSKTITDAMCGFRIYPVRKTLRALNALIVDKRMGFDIEVLVRLSWAAVPMKFFPVTVRYPDDGISHFRMVRDNIGITLVHTKLFIGMIFRLPRLVWQRIIGVRR